MRLNGPFNTSNSSFINFSWKKYLILGGGRTSSEDDLLLRFKRKFSEKSYDFFVGSLTHNKKFYKEIVAKAEL